MRLESFKIKIYVLLKFQNLYTVKHSILRVQFWIHKRNLDIAHGPRCINVLKYIFAETIFILVCFSWISKGWAIGIAEIGRFFVFL